MPVFGKGPHLHLIGLPAVAPSLCMPKIPQAFFLVELSLGAKAGADDEIRTRDLLHGKETL